MNYESLYEEFGKELVHITRRELTAKNGKPPTYLELLAALVLKKGPGK